MRLLVALAFLGAWVAVFASGAEPSDGTALATWAGLGLGAGAVIARWWAVLLAVGYGLIAVVGDVAAACLPQGGAVTDACDADVAGLVALVEAPAMAITLALGVLAGKVARRTLR